MLRRSINNMMSMSIKRTNMRISISDVIVRSFSAAKDKKENDTTTAGEENSSNK